MNILSLLAEKSEKHPNKIAFAFHQNKTNEYDEISFSELDSKSSRVAIFLSNNGFTRGMKTLVLVRPSIEFIILVYGMFKLGVVPIFPPNLNLKSPNGRKQFRSILERANIDALIGSRKILLISYLLRVRSFSNKIISMDKIRSYYLDSNNNSEYIIESDVDWANNSVFVKYTTGSTGPSKGVIYNHNMLHSHIKLLKSEGINSEDIFFGRSGTLIVHPLIGLTSVIHTNRPIETTGEEIVEAVNRWSVTACFLSPPSAINLSNYLELLDSEGFIKKAFPTLERLYVGGETVSSEVVRTIEPHLSSGRPKKGGYHLVYGATEGFPLCQNQAINILESDSKTKSGNGICLGKAVSGVKIRILTFRHPLEEFDNSLAVDVTGKGINSIGEISVSGPVVYTRLIAGDEKAFGGPLTWARDTNDRTTWHRTGDLGYIDAEDRIWLVGRKKHRVELSNGVTLYPKQIEPILDSMFDIRTALVNGPNNSQAFIIVENSNQNWEILVDKLKHSIPTLCKFLKNNIDFSFVQFGEAFPVDSGHQAKIRREVLSDWLRNK
tara:strand:+ start:631 stop:2283 length:1653 start_codon:yes stop_codon:yes gene_type:complete